MIDYSSLEQFLSEERLNKYLKYTDNDIKLAIKLYELNIEISQSLYLPLNYFEVFLRNYCNNKLVKEINNSWLNSNILFGNNKEKEKLTFKKIEEVKLRIIKHKKENNILNYIPNNNDIVSNLDLGFWTNLFCANYENTIWAPYLKHIFVGFQRKDLFKIINTIRELRNRIFHYEPIIFNQQYLEEQYNNIIAIIGFISNDTICDYIENKTKFRLLLKELKNSGAPLN